MLIFNKILEIQKKSYTMERIKKRVRKEPMAAIREISERAHVSPATVSKVLNGKGSVRDATRQMIPDIAGS